MSAGLEKIRSGQGVLPGVAVLRAERRRRSLERFVKDYWHILEGNRPLEWNWHLTEICKVLESVSRGELNRVVICVPPGSMKSTLVSVMWSAWEWLPGNWPERRILTVSGAERVSVRDSIKVQTLFDSPEYQEDMNLLANEHGKKTWGMSAVQDQKDHFANTVGGFRMALTTGQRITGLRGDRIIIDDPLDVADVMKGSEERVQERMLEVWEWYEGKLLSRRNDERNDAIVIIMQRLHDMDLAGQVLSQERLKQNPKFKALVFPLEYDPDIAVPEDPRTEPGEVLDPKRWPPDLVAEKRMMPRNQYPAQYGQNPLPASGGMFKSEYFTNTYAWVNAGWRMNQQLMKDYGHIPDGYGAKRRGLPEQFRRLILSADTAVKAKLRNDPSVFCLWGEDFVGDYWLLDVVKGRWEPPQLCAQGVAICTTHRPDKILIEDAATGSTLAGHIKDNLQGQLVELIKVRREQDAKVIRAQDAEMVWSSGRVHVPDDSCPWMMDFRTEHLRFPKGSHDDQVDAASIALVWLHGHRTYFQYRTNLDNQFNDTDVLTTERKTREVDAFGMPMEIKRQLLQKEAEKELGFEGRALWGRLAPLLGEDHFS